MADYGKLTFDRPTKTKEQMNAQYDFYIVQIVGTIPADFKYDAEGNSVWGSVDLLESDPLSAAAIDFDSLHEIAIAIVRRWVRRVGYLCLTSEVSVVYEAMDEYVSSTTIIDYTDEMVNETIDMLSPQFKDDPRILATIIRDSGIDFGRYGDEMIEALVEQARVWIDTGTYYPYPFATVQNIYEAVYASSDRSYDSIIVRSKMPTLTLGYGTSLLQQSAQGGLSVRFSDAELTNMGTSFQITEVPTLAEVSFAGSFLQTIERKPISNYQPMSNTGGKETEISLGAGRSSIYVKDQFSIVQRADSATSDVQTMFTDQGRRKKVQAILRSQTPVSGTNTSASILGNSVSNAQSTYRVGNIMKVLNMEGDSKVALRSRLSNTDYTQAVVSQRINSNGEISDIDPRSEDNSLVFNGFVKLRNLPRSSDMSFKGISRFVYHSSSSAGTTMTSEILYDQNSGNGFPRPGSLGTESFEDLGYNKWCVGTGTTIFTMNLDDDVGYNGFAAGTQYDYGGVEKFDDGWAKGASPYARQQLDAQFSEDLSSQCDGSKTTFSTTYNFVEGTLKVYWNGQQQIEGNTFTNGDDLKSFTTGFTPPSTSNLVVVYQRFYQTQQSSYQRSSFPRTIVGLLR